MIEEGDLAQNALLSDDEIAVKAMQLGLDCHYPGRIRLQAILAESFLCDWKRRHIITELIVHYGLGKYADSSKGDLLIGVESAMALKSEDPIAFMNQLADNKRRPITPSIQAKQVIYNTGTISNSSVNQSRDSRLPADLPRYQPITAEVNNPHKRGAFFTKISNNPIWSGVIATVIGGLAILILDKNWEKVIQYIKALIQATD